MQIKNYQIVGQAVYDITEDPRAQLVCSLGMKVMSDGTVAYYALIKAEGNQRFQVIVDDLITSGTSGFIAYGRIPHNVAGEFQIFKIVCNRSKWRMAIILFQSDNPTDGLRLSGAAYEEWRI